jgi:hypothetical protein
MQQVARNVTMEGCGALRDCRYLLHDRDTKYTQSFRAIIASGQVEPLVLPARSPNLNAHAERWVRSVKEECLCKVILFGERSLQLLDKISAGPRPKPPEVAQRDGYGAVFEEMPNDSWKTM